MNINLSRKLKTEGYIVKSEVKKLVERKEITAILMLAKEKGGRVTPKDIISELLANRPEKVGKRVIEWCASQKVLTFKGELTSIGEESLIEGKVFMGESGIFEIELTEDPLVPEKLVSLKPSLHGRIWKEIGDIRNSGVDYNIEEDLIDLPKKVIELANEPNNRYNGIGQDGEDIRIEQIDEKGMNSDNPNGSMRVELHIHMNDQAQVIIKNEKNTRQREMQNIYYEETIKAILGNRFKDLDINTNTLRISYDELDDLDKRNFTKELFFSNPVIPDLGTFDAITLSFNILPKSNADANQWARWLIVDRVTNYVFDYPSLVTQIKQEFTGYSIELPAQKDLAQEILEKEGRTAKYWCIQAPLDLKIGD